VDYEVTEYLYIASI